MQTEAIQFLQTTPEQLSEQIFNNLKSLLLDFKKSLSIPDPDELLSREQVCTFLQINSSTLWAWTSKGKVKAYGIGNRRYYKKNELLQSLVPLKVVA
jgi:predicted oxidoreductase